MDGRPSQRVGPSFEWLREEREKHEAKPLPRPCTTEDSQAAQERHRHSRSRSRNRSPARDRSRSKGGGGQQGGSKAGKGKGKGKEDGKEDTSNDWHCDCGQRNFARRTECFKCKEKRRSSRSRGSDSRSRDRDRLPGREREERRLGSSKSGGGKDTQVFSANGSRHPNDFDRGREGKSKGDSKGKPSGGDGGEKQTPKEDSRALFLEKQKGSSRSRSRGGSSCSSSSARAKKKRKVPGLWDSMTKVPEMKPVPVVPVKKKKLVGLHVETDAKVDLHGLVGAAQYNGCEGKVLAGPNEKGRWKVQILYQGGVKELALLPANLEPKPTCGWELVILGLGNLFTDEDVKQAFIQFGHVEKCTVRMDPNGQSTGVALVVMKTRESAEAAIGLQDEISVRGKAVWAQWSTMVKRELGLSKNRDEETGMDDAPAPRKFQEKSGAADAALAQGETRATTREAPQPDTGSTHPTGLSSCPFSAGDLVEVSGLKGAPQYNGTTGRIQSIRADGRCEVLVGSHLRPPEPKVLALKTTNLTLASEPVSEPMRGRQRSSSAASSSGSRSKRPARRFQE